MVGLLAIGSGCATIDKDDCPKVDWYRLGQQDGQAGRPESHLHEHRRACREVNVQPDEPAWRKGWLEGLQSYCQLPVALRSGLEGRSYAGVCAGPIDLAFREVHAAALAVYEGNRRLRDINSSLSSRERDLTRSGLSDRDRERIRAEIRDLDRRRADTRSELMRRERDLDFLRLRYRI